MFPYLILSLLSFLFFFFWVGINSISLLQLHSMNQTTNLQKTNLKRVFKSQEWAWQQHSHFGDLFWWKRQNWKLTPWCWNTNGRMQFKKLFHQHFKTALADILRILIVYHLPLSLLPPPNLSLLPPLIWRFCSHQRALLPPLISIICPPYIFSQCTNWKVKVDSLGRV